MNTQRNEWRLWIPSRGNLLVAVLVLSIFFWLSPVIAFPPTAVQLLQPSNTMIPYQGRLTNAVGDPVTATTSISFRLYAAANGGSVLWAEVQTVQITAGLFNVLLGSTVPVPQTIITGNNTLWLGLAVNNDTEMVPRVQLGSVPYAIQALTVPDGSIGTAKIADGAISASKLSRRMTKVVATSHIFMPSANTKYDLLAVSITLDRETLISVHASAGFQQSTDAFFGGYLIVDGIEMTHGDNWIKGGIGEQIVLSTSMILPAGTYQIILRGMSDRPNGFAIGNNRTQLIVIEG